MKDSIRCCISCILPCGALDVIRIVHASGRIEEISRAVCARDIMQAYPKHVLRKPPSSSAFDIDEGHPRGAVVLPPSAELQRGKIYFLMPVSGSSSSTTTTAEKSTRKRPKKECRNDSNITDNENNDLLSAETYLSEILSETNSDRRRGRVGVWRPHLERIEEIANDV